MKIYSISLFFTLISSSLVAMELKDKKEFDIIQELGSNPENRNTWSTILEFSCKAPIIKYLQENISIKTAILKEQKYVWCLGKIINDTFASSSKSIIQLWSLYKKESLQTLKGHTGHVWSICKLAKNRLISGSADNTIKLWDLTTNQELATLTGHTGHNGVLSLCKIDQGKFISGAEDKTIRLWDLSTNKEIGIFQDHASTIYGLSRLTENEFASGSLDSCIKLWDLRVSKTFETLHDHKRGVYSLYKTGEHTLASGSLDTTIKLWDLRVNKQLATLEGHKGAVWSLCKIENILASGSADHMIKLWDLSAHKEVATLSGQQIVYGLCKMKKNILVSGYKDGTIKRWNLNNFLSIEKDVEKIIKNPSDHKKSKLSKMQNHLMLALNQARQKKEKLILTKDDVLRASFNCLPGYMQEAFQDLVEFKSESSSN